MPSFFYFLVFFGELSEFGSQYLYIERSFELMLYNMLRYESPDHAQLFFIAYHAERLLV